RDDADGEAKHGAEDQQGSEVKPGTTQGEVLIDPQQVEHDAGNRNDCDVCQNEQQDAFHLVLLQRVFHKMGASQFYSRPLTAQERKYSWDAGKSFVAGRAES